MSDSDLITITVKHGPNEHIIAQSPSSSILELKRQLEGPVGLPPRQQKLIHKGKVLEDHQALSTSKLVNGSKVMLLAAQNSAAGGSRSAAAPAGHLRPSAPGKATSTSRGSGSSTGQPGSSLLAEKMAHMAKSAAARSSGDLPGLAERRSAWSKMGIIALRDLNLTAVEPSWFEGIGVARTADLSHNRLASLPSSLCQLTSLTTLKATHNCLQDVGFPWQQLCSALSTSLYTLQLGHNQLQLVPGCLSQLVALTQLGLENCQVSQIEAGAFQGLSKLEIVQLQGNQLQELPSSIGDCCSLVAFNASHNALAALPGTMTKLTKLQVLAVDANKLKSLPAQLLSGCSSLCTLSAHQNPLTVEDLRAADGYQDYEARRQARASKQLGGRVMADTDRAFSEGADVEQWQRWLVGPSGLGSDGSGRAGQK